MSTSLRLALSILTLTPLAGLASASTADDPLIENVQLTAFDGVTEDWFGYDVAIDGDTLIVGAYQDDDSFSAAGAAYVYVRSGSSWSLQQKLVASDPSQNALFGFSVALEGNTAVVGAKGVAASMGAAYVFVRSGSTWTQQERIEAPDGLFGDRFGEAVDISGETAVIGAPRDDPGGISNSGSAYVFVRSGMTWAFEQRFDASNPSPSDFFGVALSISGNTIVAGVQHQNHAGNFSGAAYVFLRSGVTWSEQQILVASDAEAGDSFGGSVALDGDTVLIGARFDNDVISRQGSVYEFIRTGTTWIEQAKIQADDAASQDRFGTDVALDGNFAVVGALLDDRAPVSDTGSAYVFQRIGTTWTQQFKLVSSSPAINDSFGFAVSIADGQAFVGSYLNNEPTPDSGSAYVYHLSNSFCYGVACPCGNDDAQAGCSNSTSKGGKLEAPLQISITSGSLALSASDLPPLNLGLIVATNEVLITPAQVGDGSLCIGGSSVYRFAPSVIAADGTLVVPNAFSTAPPGFFVAGEFRYFQAWSRDVFCTPLPVPCASPCGGGSNVTNAVEVLFRP